MKETAATWTRRGTRRVLTQDIPRQARRRASRTRPDRRDGDRPALPAHHPLAQPGDSLSRDVGLTEVRVVAHPPDGPEGHQRQQPRAHEGPDAGEEEEQAHDGALHGLGGGRVGELQTCGNNGCREGGTPTAGSTARCGAWGPGAVRLPPLPGGQYGREFKNQWLFVLSPR